MTRVTAGGRRAGSTARRGTTRSRRTSGSGRVAGRRGADRGSSARAPRDRSLTPAAGGRAAGIERLCGSGRTGYTGPAMPSDQLVVRGAREHNLKNITVSIPRDRLVVVTGLSGSGKSSLAFDTIYAEGQRRYVESLSAYARQFLGQMEKPDVDQIDGLSPAISIDQKGSSRNPRSTVGTVTEIYDHLRLLFARVGHPHCPACGREIERQTVQQIVDQVLRLPEDTRLLVLGPLIKDRKTEGDRVFEAARKQGFVRVRVNGEAYDLADAPSLDKYKRHTIEVIVDRFVVHRAETPEGWQRDADGRPIDPATAVALPDPDAGRLADSIETALRLGEGVVGIAAAPRQGEPPEFEERRYSERYTCPYDGTTIDELEPRSFSFNSPHGACPACTGLGTRLEIDPELVIPDKTLSVSRGALLRPWARMPMADSWFGKVAEAVTRAHGWDPDAPIGTLPPEALDYLLNAKKGEQVVIGYRHQRGENTYTASFEGIIPNLERRYKETESEFVKAELERFMVSRPCPTCAGRRLRPEALAVTVDGRDIGAGLMGVLYILDEPSIGLHQRDNAKLIATLTRLRDLGNTVLVVEHDEETIRTADWVLDIGPGAGEHGGEVIANGPLDVLLAAPRSITGAFLRGERSVPIPAPRRPGNGKQLVIRGARAHNLKNIDVALPLGTFVAVCGVSGSGKSTLVSEILYREIARRLNGARDEPGPHDDVTGIDQIDKIIEIDQSPIGRTPRSNPATYVGLFGPIRELFAGVPEARVRGYKPGRFSFNVKGGRCENCKGDGILKIEMQFLPDVYVQCEVCHGKRYNREALEILFKGRSIADVLEMTIEEALDFFSPVPSVRTKLQTLFDVGLGYVHLGQPATTLSGGDAQRVKLATELSRRATGRTIYVLDEPTTGLHFADVEKLLQVLHRLVDSGNTVLVIEHNLDVIKTADWLIELGPAGGFRGGRIVAEGTPEDVAAVVGSATGEYLGRVLRGEPLIPLSGVTFADDAGRGSLGRRGMADGNGAREAIALPIEAPRKRAVSSRS